MGTPPFGLQNPAGLIPWVCAEDQRALLNLEAPTQQRTSSNDGDTTSGLPSLSEVFNLFYYGAAMEILICFV